MSLQFCRLLEKAYCYLAISFLMRAYSYLPSKFAGVDLDGTRSGLGAQNLYNTFSEAFVFAGLVILFTVRWRQTLSVLRASLAINAFVVLALASVLWSLEPDLTLRGVFKLMTAVGFGYYLASRFSPVEVIRMVAVATVVAGVASAVLAVLAPQVGRMHGSPDHLELAGAWEGVFTHKNTLGATMIVACLTTGWLLIHERRSRLIRVASLVLCLGVAVMTRSRTSQIAILALVPFSVLVRTVRLPGLLRLWVFYLVLLGGLIVAVLGASFFSDIMYALGKDPSMTGRLPLWSLLITEIGQRPLLGYGYGAFYVLGNHDLDYIRQMIGWLPAESHQGYIEVAVQVGVVGLLIAIWIWLGTLMRALAATRDRTLPWAPLAAVYVLTIGMTNMDEASLMDPSALASLLLPYFSVALCLEASQRKTALRSRIGAATRPTLRHRTEAAAADQPVG